MSFCPFKIEKRPAAKRRKAQAHPRPATSAPTPAVGLDFGVAINDTDEGDWWFESTFVVRQCSSSSFAPVQTAKLVGTLFPLSEPLIDCTTSEPPQGVLT